MKYGFILLLLCGILIPARRLSGQAVIQYHISDLEYEYTIRMDGVHHVAEAKPAIAVIHELFGVMPVFYQSTGEMRWTSRKNKIQGELQDRLNEHGFMLTVWNKKIITNKPIDQKEE